MFTNKKKEKEKKYHALSINLKRWDVGYMINLFDRIKP